MKIEIELKDIESLRRQIKNLEKDKRELETELNSLDKKQLRKDAVDLARYMFGSIINKVFKELGFKDGINLSDIDFRQLEHYLGKEWWKGDKIYVTYGAEITNYLRSAYLKIGIKAKE